MRACNPACMPFSNTPPAKVLRRHSRMADANNKVMGSAGVAPTFSKRFSSDPPDQKASSNRSPSSASRRMRRNLSTMIAHDHTDAASKITSTNCTTRSARKNRLIKDRSAAPLPPRSSPSINFSHFLLCPRQSDLIVPARGLVRLGPNAQTPIRAARGPVGCVATILVGSKTAR